MPVFGVAKFERFFRAAAGLDVDKDDLKRYNEFVHHKVHDLLLIGQTTAEANNRDIIQPQDLPITKGLQECVHAFRKMDEDIELRRVRENGGLSGGARELDRDPVAPRQRLEQARRPLGDGLELHRL